MPNDVAIVLRPRNDWEAADLGLELARAWSGQVASVWAVGYVLPALAVVLLSPAPVGLRDHAAFLWTLARLDGPRAPLLVAAVAPAEVDAAWLVARGWPTLIGGAVLAVLALWRVLPRQGPIWPPPAPARRQLGEHRQAIGTFHLNEGDRQQLVQAWQRAVAEQLRRRPWIARTADLARLEATPSTPADTIVVIQRLPDLWRRIHRS